MLLFKIIIIVVFCTMVIILYSSIKADRVQNDYLRFLQKVEQNFKQELRDASLREFIFTNESSRIYKKYTQRYPNEKDINSTIKAFLIEYNKEINNFIRKNKITLTKDRKKSKRKHSLKPYQESFFKNIQNFTIALLTTLFFTYPFILIAFFDDDSNEKNKNYQCRGKTYCYEMNSCSEAEFYLNECGLDRLDGDYDGVPCEKLCN